MLYLFYLIQRVCKVAVRYLRRKNNIFFFFFFFGDAVGYHFSSLVASVLRIQSSAEKKKTDNHYAIRLLRDIHICEDLLGIHICIHFPLSVKGRPIAYWMSVSSVFNKSGN